MTERGRQPLDGHGTIAPAAFPVSPPPPDDAPEPEAVAWLDELEDVMETLGAALAEAQWALYTSGSGEALGRLGGARAAFYGDPAVTAALGAWRTRALAPQTARRVELLCREFELEQVRAEREIARAVGDMVELQAHQRAHLHGKVVSDDVLVGLLRSSPDPSEREAAWRARASLGEHLAPRLRSLAAMRNRAAQRLGWSSYWELGLAAAEMEEATLGPLLESMERATRAPWEAHLERVRRATKTRTPGLWDLGYSPDGRAQTLGVRFTGPELVTRAFDAFRSTGLPLEELNLTMDLEPRPGKSEHAYCFPVRPPHDIRVLANLTPGLDSYETMFHELGHAVQAAGVAQRSVILRDPPSGAFSEAIGQLFGGLVSTPSWLTGALGMSAGDADEVRAWVRERRLVAARWSLVWIAVERQLFCAPSQDPTAVFWDECARVLGVDASPELRGIAAWARVPHYVGHPVYLQNYLVADVIAAQLEETLEARFGGLHEQREAGAALRTTIFEPGAVLRGDALLRSVTGRDLDLGPYLRRWLGVAWPADGIAT